MSTTAAKASTGAASRRRDTVPSRGSVARTAIRFSSTILHTQGVLSTLDTTGRRRHTRHSRQCLARRSSRVAKTRHRPRGLPHRGRHRGHHRGRPRRGRRDHPADQDHAARRLDHLGRGSPTTSSYRAPLYNRLVGEAGYAVDFVGSQRSGSLPTPTTRATPAGGSTRSRRTSTAGSARTSQTCPAAHRHQRHEPELPGGHGPAAARRADRPDPRGPPHRHRPRREDRPVARRHHPGADQRLQRGRSRCRGLRGTRAKLVDLSGTRASDLNDTLHPNDSGYARMAVRWYSPRWKRSSATAATGPCCGPRSRPATPHRPGWTAPARPSASADTAAR